MIDCVNKFLVAPPRIGDWRFQKTVIYIWKHDVTGTSGVIINKPLSHPTFQDICHMGSVKKKAGHNPGIYYGGPVADNMVGVLHTLDVRMHNTNIATPKGLGFTIDKTMIEHIAQGKIKPAKVKMCLGLTSWEVGQLEAEIKAEPPRPGGSGWLLLDFDKMLSFTHDLKEEAMWEKCVNMAIQQKTKNFIGNIFQ